MLVPMLMGVNMGMLMGVLQTDGIPDHKNRRNDHDGEAHIELDAGTLVQQEHSKGHTQERCDGIISAGLGGTQILLGSDVEVNTQTVGHEAQQEHFPDPEEPGDRFTDYQSNCKAAQTAEGTLDGGNLDGRFGTEHPCTVVFQTPAAGGTQHQQRNDVELETAFSLKAQRDAGSGNQNDCQSEPPGQGLPEYEEGDHGGCHDFKVIQQGSVVRIGAFQTQHQKNGSGNVQNDHSSDILKELFSRYTMLFPQEVPQDFLIHHLTGSFAETVKWWGSSRFVKEKHGKEVDL